MWLLSMRELHNVFSRLPLFRYLMPTADSDFKDSHNYSVTVMLDLR